MSEEALKISGYTTAILDWYAVNRRDLPWRKTTEPYKVWLSEIMLQQTRVSQGLPYYMNFIKKFPTIRSLAKASEEEVLHQWQGLGYYTRARNLHKCAKKIVSDYGGIFPESFSELQKLPGIGSYTAAAIASICFKEPVPVLDGNVFRVLSRLFNIEHDINSAAGKKSFMDLAQALITDDNPGDFNQAIMEFGALQCIPKKPGCETCSLMLSCESYAAKNQMDRPVKSGKKKKRNRFFNYLVLGNNKGIYMNQRIKNDIWKGLYDFQLIESDVKVTDRMVFLNDLGTNKEVEWHIHHIKEYKHVLTHQVIHATFYFIDLNISVNKLLSNSFKNSNFYDFDQIENLPKPVLIDNYLKEGIF
jgi:A/G-specific adenine glycosylase